MKTDLDMKIRQEIAEIEDEISEVSVMVSSKVPLCYIASNKCASICFCINILDCCANICPPLKKKVVYTKKKLLK